MWIKIGEHNVPCYLSSQENIESPFTKKPIKKVVVELVVHSNKDYNYINTYLSENKSIVIKNDNNEENKMVRGNYSSQFITGGSKYSFSINAQEEEMLTIDKLIINELEVYPVKYSEEISKDALIITSTITGSNDVIDKARKLILARNEFFDVLRVGISDEHKRMRFGRIFNWCVEENGEITQAFNLVEDKYDSKKQLNNAPIDQVDKLIDENIELKYKVEYLYKMLLEKSIIEKRNSDDYSKDQNEDYCNMYFDYYKVKSVEYIDSYFDE